MNADASPTTTVPAYADLSADARADAYLERIGAARPERADAAALRELQLRHLTAVPFENLSVHYGEDIVLEEGALFDKVVGARRGGFCYELNGAFAFLLRALGFRVTLLQARVFGDGGQLGIPYDHMALRVETDDDTGPWLADVGFGEHALWPLALDDRAEQQDPGGAFRFREAPQGDVDLLRGGCREFRLDLRPRSLAEFRVGAWYHRTSPDSHFLRSVVCSRVTDDGRITLSGRKLVRTVEGERHETPLETDAEVLAAYRDHFGLLLDRLPEVATPRGRTGGANA
ncbi:arylamine N-acetyltransferase family protein [Streptomyces fulvorobeus]|uniref:N-hydroxyarylamine O-acetyltransferase n=1 Tax=Streptomyces fulvorobeus TaxID=284028 RepID=A0A7J0C3M2_9ACTN|nr:arylamine N-acetyltransferase [Streptomyces fulvorobeus]NYE40806.1 N-hydroxyarylamine O-acetyltransferase [Streptomyces fulvorobeus]GFM97115.1 N-hydroxyarylamine O-acetyltransferase [Streptomyces fulvorobeus]